MATTQTGREADGPAYGGPILRLEGVHKRFGELEVLRGIDLNVKGGEVICIIGASGSGKSTLLRCINLLEPPDEGDIYLEGRKVGRVLAVQMGRGGTMRAAARGASRRLGYVSPYGG